MFEPERKEERKIECSFNLQNLATSPFGIPKVKNENYKKAKNKNTKDKIKHCITKNLLK